MKGAPEDVESCAEGVPLTAGCAELAVADALEALRLRWPRRRVVAVHGHARCDARCLRGMWSAFCCGEEKGRVEKQG